MGQYDGAFGGHFRGKSGGSGESFSVLFYVLNILGSTFTDRGSRVPVALVES